MWHFLQTKKIGNDSFKLSSSLRTLNVIQCIYNTVCTTELVSQTGDRIGFSLPIIGQRKAIVAVSSYIFSTISLHNLSNIGRLICCSLSSGSKIRLFLRLFSHVTVLHCLSSFLIGHPWYLFLNKRSSPLLTDAMGFLLCNMNIWFLVRYWLQSERSLCFKF